LFQGFEEFNWSQVADHISLELTNNTAARAHYSYKHKGKQLYIYYIIPPLEYRETDTSFNTQ